MKRRISVSSCPEAGPGDRPGGGEVLPTAAGVVAAVLVRHPA
jgi:hypothetical protein